MLIEGMKSQDLVRLQIELEYRLSPEGRLVPFPGSTEQCRFIVHKMSDGICRFFREDLPDAICRELETIPGEEAICGSEKVKAILSTHAPCGSIWTGRSYFFPRLPDADAFRGVAKDEDRFVVMESGELVSWAYSARENDVAAELAVETLHQFRRRGLARAVTMAWAHFVMKAGKVAFFSHSHDNVASEALAASLGVEWFTTGAAYD